MKKLVIWYNPNKKELYHRFYNSFKTYDRYPYDVGTVNSYGHIIVYVLDSLYQPYMNRTPFKQRVITKLISFLKKL